MEKLQRLSMTLIFTLVLATSAAAGEIPIDKTPPPPPPASAMAAPGEIPIDERSSTSEGDSFGSTSLTDVTLSLLQIMLSVF